MRFVFGDYAWAMHEGMIIAYVLDGKSETDLSSFLKKNSVNTQLVEPPSYRPKNGRLCTSHRRIFAYKENNKKAPNIILRHMWLE